MLVLCDIYELVDAAIDEEASVHVVKNPQLRFEWPSLMVFNNENCMALTPEYIQDEHSKPQSFDWANKVAGLPAEYNHCIGYDAPRSDAKIVHYTQGIPCFPETEDSEYREEWMDELNMVRASVPWIDIMGNSVHAQPVLKRRMARGMA